MPEYFYHIGVEVMDQHPAATAQAAQIDASLKPFKSRNGPTARIAREARPSSSSDERADRLTVQEMGIEAGIGSFANLRTRAIFEETSQEEPVIGIIHLYRDTEETSHLYMNHKNKDASTELWTGSARVRQRNIASTAKAPRDNECTTVAILAVPSYLTPKDFLAFVGEKTVDAVSHIRMIKTAKLNRYMVLMRFTDGRYARQWQHDWNGRVFNSVEPETCHVVFVNSVEVIVNSSNEETSIQVKDTTLDKPLPPPTPTLVELPTCPVCLERMDESTGLLTILCQHVFHCSCLEKWSGGGCPVCRFSNDDFTTSNKSRLKTKTKTPNAYGEYDPVDDNQCQECSISENLWQCLICGHVGCGRYKKKHAFQHYEHTNHSFTIDLSTQHVWDYARDCYVHKIIANGSSVNEKLIELPGRSREGQTTALENVDEDLDVAKRENLAFEYTQLLSSQLDSQREYFEESLRRAADKASDAQKRAERAEKRAYDALLEAQDARQAVENARISQLNSELERLRADQDKAQTISFNHRTKITDLQHRLSSEQALSASLAANLSKAQAQLSAQQNKISDLSQQEQTSQLILQELENELQQLRHLRDQAEASKHIERLVQQGVLSVEEAAGASVQVTSTDATISKSSKQRRKKKHKRGQQQEGAKNVVQGQASEDVRGPAAIGIEKLAEALKDFQLTAGDPNDIIRVLVEQGLVERKDEEGLYDDD